jgi:hypothetical protein
MKISHEVPLSLLKHNYEWSDYDYLLPHLLDKYQEYKDYFLKARKDERFIIQDNGLFAVIIESFHSSGTIKISGSIK